MSTEIPDHQIYPHQIFQMLPFTKAEAVSYELEDQTGCLHVRPKRYVYPSYREEEVDAYSVFQVLCSFEVASFQLEICFSEQQYWGPASLTKRTTIFSLLEIGIEDGN